jgi:hypothetical protein
MAASNFRRSVPSVLSVPGSTQPWEHHSRATGFFVRGQSLPAGNLPPELDYLSPHPSELSSSDLPANVLGVYPEALAEPTWAAVPDAGAQPSSLSPIEGPIQPRGGSYNHIVTGPPEWPSYPSVPIINTSSHLDDPVLPASPSVDVQLGQSIARLNLGARRDAPVRPTIRIDPLFEASDCPTTPSPFELASLSARSESSHVALSPFRASSSLGSESPCTTLAHSSPDLPMDPDFPKIEHDPRYTDPNYSESPESQTMSQTIEGQFQNALS